MRYSDEDSNVENVKTNTKIMSDNIEETNLRKRVKELALPSLAELILGTLFGMVDMVMVGNVNTESLAAVGLANQPMMLALAVFQALNVGSTALVARFMGTDDNESASAVVKQTLILTAIMGILVSVPGYIFADKVIGFMGAKPEVLPLAVRYIEIIALGGVFITTTMGIGAALRAPGIQLHP